MSSALYRDLLDRIVEEIRAYQKKFPLQTGISREELKTAGDPGIDVRLFDLAIRELEKTGRIVAQKEYIRTPDHLVHLQGELEDLRGKIENIYLEAGSAPPTYRETLEALGGNPAAASVVKVMLKEGLLVKVSEELYFHRDSLNRLRETYRELLIKTGKSTPADLRDLTGLSRKFIIPLMEYFDAAKFTIRVGDHRVLRGEGK